MLIKFQYSYHIQFIIGSYITFVLISFIFLMIINDHVGILIKITSIMII